MMATKSIYKSDEGGRAIAAFYDSILARWSVPCDMLDIPTRHGQTFVIASGSPAAPALVQLHGSSTNSAMWAGDITTYSRYYRVYTVDTLGEPGKSAPNRPPLAGPAYAEWLEDVFNALAIQKAVLMGCSQGGWMALKFATYRPERVEKLVLLTPGGVTPVKLSFVLRLIGLSLFGRWGAGAIRRVIYGDLVMPEEVEAFASLIQEHYNPRTDAQPIFSDEELQGLAMPVLLVAGSEDCCYVSEKTADRLQRLLPVFTANVLPGVGHVLLDTTSQVVPFLAGTASPLSETPPLPANDGLPGRA